MWHLIQQVTHLLCEPGSVLLSLNLYLDNVYIAAFHNNRIRKVTISTGIITTIAGTGTGSYSGDSGAATSATLNGPLGVALDSTGTYSLGNLLFPSRFYLFFLLLDNVYIADQSNNRIRKVTVSIGIITTIAGSSTSGSYSGDNGQATGAALYYPSGVTLDSAGTQSFWNIFGFIYLFFYLGNVYIADYFNHRIRKVTVSTGIITTIAGTGLSSYSGDNGQATSATLNYPYGISLDSSGTHSLTCL
jgi:DNA-binding beta-propeller fold protein YncE